MTQSEVASLNWDLKEFDTTRKEDEREPRNILRTKPKFLDSECLDFKRLKTCVECSYWDSCPER